MPQNQKEFKVLTPRHETLNIMGDISYGESQRAWNLIRLKKEILQEFPQLKERQEAFIYRMILHRNYKDLKKELIEMEKKNLPIPIFLFLGKKQYS